MECESCWVNNGQYSLAQPFLSPVSSHFHVSAFLILRTRRTRSLEQSMGAWISKHKDKMTNELRDGANAKEKG